MNRFPILMAVALSMAFNTLKSQNGLPDNMYLDVAYHPFLYGVASGDPLQNAVIIWTKVFVDSNTLKPVNLTWEVANDSVFQSIVNTGNITCAPQNNFTTQADVTGLLPGHHYYYRFYTAEKRFSQIGKTQTLPPDTVSHFKLALVSCSGVWSGYFNAYRRIAERDDIDFLIHVGDYIYDDVDPDEHVRMPDFELKSPTNLAEWRARHTYYLLDPDLRFARQQKPWIVEWDNHDTHYKESEKNKDGIKAFYEYVPVRIPDTTHLENIYRSFRFGNLANLNMIDMYMFRGNEEFTKGQQSILGNVQDDWLKTSLAKSTTQWHLLGNQEMMGSWISEGLPKILPAPGNGIFFAPGYWDGYVEDRNRLYDFIDSLHLNNLVVLSGDLHMSFVIDLVREPRKRKAYNRRTGEGALGVEVLTPSITAGNMDEERIPLYMIPVFQSLSRNLNPHHRWVQFSKHGYTTIDVTGEKCVAQFCYSEILNRATTETLGKKFTVKSGQNHWEKK